MFDSKAAAAPVLPVRNLLRVCCPVHHSAYGCWILLIVQPDYWQRSGIKRVAVLSCVRLQHLQQHCCLALYLLYVVCAHAAWSVTLQVAAGLTCKMLSVVRVAAHPYCTQRPW